MQNGAFYTCLTYAATVENEPLPERTLQRPLPGTIVILHPLHVLAMVQRQREFGDFSN